MVQQVRIAELAQRLHPRETVFIAGSSGEPIELTTLLGRDAAVAPGVNFITSFIPGLNLRNLAPVDADRRMRVFFLAPDHADGRRAGRIEFCPWSYSTIQQHLANPHTQIDSLVVQVGRPGRDGCCPLGAAVEFVPSLLSRKLRVLAVVNPNVPEIAGSLRIPMERFECYADSDAPLAEYAAGGTNETSNRIAEHLLALIPSGATLQIGLGKVPSQLLRGLAGRRELSFHTGMLSDSVLELAAAGALCDDLPLTTAVAIGSTGFYRRLSTVPGLRIVGVETTHNPAVLSRIPRFFAINSALEVDLLGQVNAESLGGRYVSGPGGLPDFAHAARRCEGGLSIVALNSTDASGRQSRIVASLPAGATVTVPQHDADAVVTEWGVALLRGCDLDDRVRRLIAIAHPERREELRVHAARSSMVCFSTI
jgi:acyl-CoA hydrolase